MTDGITRIAGSRADGAGVWLWLDSLKAREIGIKAAKQACAEEELQFLDDTVLIRSLRLARDDDGQLKLRRVYAFEYSDTGDNRRSGSVTLLGQRVELLHVRPATLRGAQGAGNS